MDNVLLYFSLKYNGDWEKVYNALDQKEKIETEDLIQIPNSIPNSFISIINPLYPNSLKQIIKPPFILYYLGSVSLLHNHHQIINFIGGENINEYNKKSMQNILIELINENRTILVSGKTSSEKMIIDFVIKNKGKLIIMTEEPLQDFVQSDFWYKHKDIENCDFIVLSETEHSDMFKINNNENTNILFRNLIGLAKGFVIMESNFDENISNIISELRNENKKYFAIPQPINMTDSISNQALKNGGEILEKGIDILNKI